MKFSLLLLAMLLTGCATILGSKTSQFDFNTQPQGARVVVDGTPLGTTPTTAQLSNTKEHQVVFQMQGFNDGGCTLTKSTGAGWVVADVLFGLAPIIVDAATGNWSQNKEHSCQMTLTPVDVPVHHGS